MPLPSMDWGMLGFTSGLSGLCYSPQTLWWSPDTGRRHNNTLNENNTIQTLCQSCAPDPLGFSTDCSVRTHPRGGPTAALRTVPSPSPPH